jgi:hypothetical protein
MHRILGTISLLTVAAARPSASPAQATPAPVVVMLTAGLVMPMGDHDNLYNAGFNLAGGVEFSPRTLPFGVRGELGYSRFGAETFRLPDEGGGELSIEPKSSNLAVTVNALLGPTVPSTQIRPYALAGVGFYNTSEGARIRIDDFRVSGSESEGSVGFNGGAGVRFQFVGFSSFIEARYHHVLKGRLEEQDFEDPDAVPRWTSAGFFPISFGISFGGR